MVDYILIQEETTGVVDQNFGAGNTAYGAKFTASKTTVILKAALEGRKTQEGVNTLGCAIYTHNSDRPGDLLGTAVNTIAQNDLPDSFGTYSEFFFAGVPIVLGTDYWIIALGPGSDQIRMQELNDNTGVAGTVGSWTTGADSPNFKIYESEKLKGPGGGVIIGGMMTY